VLILAGVSPAALGAETPAAVSLREVAERHVSSLPTSLAPPLLLPAESPCAGSFDKTLAQGLGLATGAALGFGLGHGSGTRTLEKEFNGFGLTDSLITAGALAVALEGHKLFEPALRPLCQGGCAADELKPHGVDAGIRQRLVWPTYRGRATADSLSHGTAVASFVLPSAFLAGSRQPLQGREFWMTVESGAITAAVLQVVKHRVHRARPYARNCDPGCRDDVNGHGAQLSFFSGHTALAFSFAVSAGTLASMRSYPNAGWVLGSGLTLATATGYFRIAADKHYFTDVLTGALIGSAVGWAVPKLHGLRDRAPDQNATVATASRTPAALVPLPVTGASGRLRFYGTVGPQATGLALSWSP
jgi:membrane-associated phospholipid phosphatase